MTTDIHAIIAAAKREQFSFGGSHANNFILEQNAIAMAEALAAIADPAYPNDSRSLIARECLDRIVKEANP